MQIYRVHEAAKILRTSKQKVHDAISRGDLKAYKDGKNWSILDKHLEEYAETKAISETERREKCR